MRVKGLYILVYFTTLAVLLPIVLGQTEEPEEPEEPGIGHECQPFCDVQGFPHPRRFCGEQFCCGTETIRYCCSDPEAARDYPADTNCPNTSWRFYQRLIIGMLLSLITMLVLMICCFYCCTSETYLATQRARRRQREMEGMAAASQDGNTVIPIQFDPESPYAFEPPDYNSLDKDPPLYGDVFGDGTGTVRITDSTELQENITTNTTSTTAPGVQPIGGAVIDNSTESQGQDSRRTCQGQAVHEGQETGHDLEDQGHENRAFEEDVDIPATPGGTRRVLETSREAALAALKHSKHKGQSTGAPLPQPTRALPEPPPDYNTEDNPSPTTTPRLAPREPAQHQQHADAPSDAPPGFSTIDDAAVPVTGTGYASRSVSRSTGSPRLPDVERPAREEDDTPV